MSMHQVLALVAADGASLHLLQLPTLVCLLSLVSGFEYQMSAINGGLLKLLTFTGGFV